jgi:hypothetical protein
VVVAGFGRGLVVAALVLASAASGKLGPVFRFVTWRPPKPPRVFGAFRADLHDFDSVITLDSWWRVSPSPGCRVNGAVRRGPRGWQKRGYYPAIVVLGSSGSELAPLTSRGKSSESDDGSRVKLIREPALQEVGSHERLDGPPPNHLGTWPWRRRVAQTKGGGGFVSRVLGPTWPKYRQRCLQPRGSSAVPPPPRFTPRIRGREVRVRRLRLELPGRRVNLGYKPSGQRWGQPAGAVTRCSRRLADGRC